MNIRPLLVSLALGLGLTLSLIGLLVGLGSGVPGPPTARAASYTVCLAGPPGCDYSSIQDAVAGAGAGDLIKVAAGTYTDLHTATVAPGQIITQLVYVDRSITLRGGYTTTNGFADPPDPALYPTTLDARGGGRVIYVTGDVTPTVEGLGITGGDASGLGGHAQQEAANDAGGGMYAISATVTISNCRVFSNTADRGGGLALYTSTATLSHNTVASNTAQHGGGLRLAGHSLAVIGGSTFSANRATHGGGLQVHESNATLSANTIQANTAFTTGGGLDVRRDSAVTLSANTIQANTAFSTGGGLHAAASTATLRDNIFADNQAQHGGGGLFLYFGGAATLSGNTFIANEARHGGGGLWLAEDCSVTLSGDRIIANIAEAAEYGGGGGLLLTKFSTATLTNVVLADNRLGTPTGVGAGLLVADSSARLLHTTIARNSGGDGSGVHVTERHGTYSTVALTNTILVSHTTGITVAAGNTASLAATLWGIGAWANDADWDGAGNIATGTVNVWDAPAFVGPGAGDYHIRPGSGAVDAGIDAGVEDDIDGDGRPFDGDLDGLDEFDIGADELILDLEVAKHASPDPVQAGGQLTYTLHVTNTGSVALHATVTDRLPEHVTPGGSLVWTPEPIAPGEPWTHTVVVTVEPGYGGPLTNVVEVTTQEGAAGVYTETSASLISPAMNVVKEANLTRANVGESITYTYTVKNTGDALLTGVSASDSRLGAIQLATTTLAPDGVTTGTATYTVQASDLPGPLVNWVRATASPPVGGELTDYAIEWVFLTSSSLTIVKEANLTHSFAFSGDLGTFTLPTGGAQSFPNLASGNYTIGEVPSAFPAPSWVLTDVTCLAEEGVPVPVDVDLASYRATIPLASDQGLTCVFLNEGVGGAHWFYFPLMLKEFTSTVLYPPPRMGAE